MHRTIPGSIRTLRHRSSDRLSSEDASAEDAGGCKGGGGAAKASWIFPHLAALRQSLHHFIPIGEDDGYLEGEDDSYLVSQRQHLQCPKSQPMCISVNAFTITEYLDNQNSIMPAVSEEALRTWGSELRDSKVSLVERTHAMWGLRCAHKASATPLMVAFLTEVHPPEPASNAFLQHETAYSLGQSGDTSAVADLEKALRDSHHEPIVRHEAAEALAALASAPGANIAHIKKVLTEFRNINIDAIAETCEVGLGRVAWIESGKNKVADPAAELARSKFPNIHVDPAPAFEPTAGHSIAELRRIILSPSEPLFSRYQALYSLRNAAVATSPPPSEVVDALCAGVAAPGSALLRHQVAFILGELSIPCTGDALIARLQDAKEAAWVRHESALGLGKVLRAAEAEEKEGKQAQRVRDALVAGCKDPEPVVRDSCIVALDVPAYLASHERF
ncbi:hypothetical protein Aperf_G00000048034 [Anoplocephala perfoliata]